MNDLCPVCGSKVSMPGTGMWSCTNPACRHYATGIKMNDLDPMPFGKHKDEPMQDVPAEYLHWLWTNGLKESRGSVAQYIWDNLEALKREYPDGIWDG